MVSEETGRISVGSFGELAAGLTIPEVLERINRHFGVEGPAPLHIDEYAADIPLTEPSAPLRAPGARAEKVNQP